MMIRQTGANSNLVGHKQNRAEQFDKINSDRTQDTVAVINQFDKKKRKNSSNFRTPRKEMNLH